jgi:hypothetical protein
MPTKRPTTEPTTRPTGPYPSQRIRSKKISVGWALTLLPLAAFYSHAQRLAYARPNTRAQCRTHQSPDISTYHRPLTRAHHHPDPCTHGTQHGTNQVTYPGTSQYRTKIVEEGSRGELCVLVSHVPFFSPSCETG